MLFMRYFFYSLFTIASLLSAAELEVIVAPRATVVERNGITGGGHPLATDKRIALIYPNHPDDFGGSAGTGSSQSTDAGLTWTPLKDNWPIPETIDLWMDQLNNGNLLALGIRWTPDPKKRRDPILQDVPADAYQLAVSKDGGENWTTTHATIDCPKEVGIIARPMPHIFEDKNGTLLMPAYAWSPKGNSSLLLQSEDHGHNWKVRSIITTPTAMIKAGATVTTPWLETSVSPTENDDLLAVVRTGSNVKSLMVSLRSSDGGKTWSSPKLLSFAGKSPTLTLLPNGVLTLVTALSRNHCRIYLSEDGTGHSWSPAHVISSLTGGNVGVTMANNGKLIITSPANGRIDAWDVQIRPEPEINPELTPPSQIEMRKGTLTWKESPKASAYRVTPILIETSSAFSDTKILPYVTTLTRNAMPKLELRRQLLPGGTYVFEISSVDEKGRRSAATRSQRIQL